MAMTGDGTASNSNPSAQGRTFVLPVEGKSVP